MTIEELTTSLKQVQATLEREMRNQALALAISALSMIKNRITQKQENEKGEKFGEYSTKQYSVSLYEARVLNRAGFESLKKRNKNKKASYYEFRQSQGLQNKNKSFEFSGQMWREITAHVTEKGQGNKLIIIEPSTKYAKEVYKYNTNREGELLILSVSEKDIIEKSLADWIFSIFQQNNIPVQLS